MLLVDLLGDLPVLSEEELRQPELKARISIGHGGLGLHTTTILAPIGFLGSFAHLIIIINKWYQSELIWIQGLRRESSVGGCTKLRAMDGKVDINLRRGRLLGHSLWDMKPHVDSIGGRLQHSNSCTSISSEERVLHYHGGRNVVP